MTPVVRYMLLCDNVRIDSDRPTCIHIDCLMNTIVSMENPPFPLVREMICIFLALTDGHGKGIGQIRVAYVDGEHEVLVFGSAEHLLDFTNHSPLERLAVVFRIEGCQFPKVGEYSVQFWYNQEKVEERFLKLR